MSEHVTDSDQRIWQRRVVNLLGKFLEMRDMPVLEWTISDAGARLKGRVKLGDYASRASRATAAADFETWRRYLEAEITTDHTSMGTRHVIALTERYDGLVRVVLVMDLPTDEDLAELEDEA